VYFPKDGVLFNNRPLFAFPTTNSFDKEDNLIKVRHVNEFTTPNSNFDEEYLIYIDRIVYGFGFVNSGNLEAVSKCTYDNGKLLKY